MYFGAAWYPEHWPESGWPEDIRLMREAGMNVCRIAEFAWSTLEPVEGMYQFGWLERAVDLAHAQGMAIVLGTPTAAPPAWLTHHHPDTLATEPSGRPAQHGNRCHYNPGSVTYQKYVRRIVDQMARRFGPDPRVIGWQIDNEYNRIDYSDDTARRFQAYLKETFVSLDSLNAHWSTAYWSQTYSDWSEIPIPIGPHNPGLMLEFRRFVSRVWRDYQKLQIDSIRAYASDAQWITHNFMGWFDGFDHYTVARDLDMASWDWYVGTGHNDYRASALTHDLSRGLKRKNFWLMETQPGCVNWSANNNMLNRGEARCMAWHAVAHGADAVLYWQWRSAPGGQEQLHGSLLGADGKPRPFYAEAQQIGAELSAAGDALAGTGPVNQVALLHSYDSRWSIAAQRHNSSFDPVDALRRFSAPLTVRNVGMDVLDPESPLEGYRLVIVSGLAVITEAAARNIEAYVRQGGTLVIGVRCAQKDEYNALLPQLQPGPLRELSGVEVEEYYALDEPVPIKCSWSGASDSATGEIWAERLRTLDPAVEILAEYGECNGWLDGGAAVTLLGATAARGAVVTVGSLMSSEAHQSLIDWLLKLAHVEPVWPESIDGVEIACRTNGKDRRILLFINHTRAHKSVPFAAAGDKMHDVLAGAVLAGSIDLPPYGVCVCVQPHAAERP